MPNINIKGDIIGVATATKGTVINQTINGDSVITKTYTLEDVKKVIGNPLGHKNTDWDDACHYWNIYGSEITVFTLLNNEPCNLEDVFPIGVDYNRYGGEFETMEQLKYFAEHGTMLNEEDWQ